MGGLRAAGADRGPHPAGDGAAPLSHRSDTYEQLAYGSENGTWRSAYLSATQELRHGNFGTPTVTAAPDIIAALTPDQLLDSLAIRVDAHSCWDEHLTLDVDLTDGDASVLSRLIAVLQDPDPDFPILTPAHGG